MWKRFLAWLKHEEVTDFRRPPDSPYHKDNAAQRWVE